MQVLCEQVGQGGTSQDRTVLQLQMDRLVYELLPSPPSLTYFTNAMSGRG